jgi:adenylate cyclase
VRRAGDRVRVNAQLIDAESERHVWAQRYDRRMDDLFELQDDIVASIATVVGPEITLAEIERVRTKRSDDLNAWDHYLRAMAAYHRLTRQDMETAIAGLEAAIQIDADFANAYALLGLCHTHVGMRGWIRPARAAFEEARRCAERAVRLAPASPEANQSLAFVLAITGQAEQAVPVARRAIDLNPNLAEGYATLGRALVFCGALHEGMAACLKAERGNPRDSRGTWLYDGMGWGHFFLGAYDKAIEIAKKGYHQDPSMFGALVTLACAHARQGRTREAKHYADELVRQMPRYSVQAIRKNPMFVDPKLVEELIDSIRLAGLPE